MPSAIAGRHQAAPDTRDAGQVGVLDQGAIKRGTWHSARALILSRRNVSPRRLIAPGPTPEQLNELLSLAAAAPDHGQLTPWRFVVIPCRERLRLAEAFARALIERDATATDSQMEAAREKAYRSPILFIAIARLAKPGDQISTAERMVSLGAALQNVLLGAQALGYGAGLTSGHGITSRAVRELFDAKEAEEPVCFVSIGTPGRLREPRLRPHVDVFTTSL